MRKCSEYHLPVSCSLWKFVWSPMQFRPTQKHYFLRSKNARSHSKTYKTDSLFPSLMVGRFWSWVKIHAKILGFFPFLHFLLSTPFLRPKTWFHQRSSVRKKKLFCLAQERIKRWFRNKHCKDCFTAIFTWTEIWNLIFEKFVFVCLKLIFYLNTPKNILLIFF